MRKFSLEQIDTVMRAHGIGEDGFFYRNRAGRVIGRNVQQASLEYREQFRGWVNHAARLLRGADRTRNFGHDVHAIKVHIEQATRQYVSNGAVLTAIYLLGIPVTRTAENSCGAVVPISRRHDFHAPA